MADKEVEEYASNFSNIVSSGFVTMAVSLGNNLGLFEVLKSLQEPVDCQTIADGTKLQERYVREWLGCMVAAKIVYMEGDNKYYIPSKFKDSLEMTWYAPFMLLLSYRQEAVERLFQGDKTAMEVYDSSFGAQYYEWQDKEWNYFVNARIDKGILPTLRKYKENLSFVLDIGCGGGVLSTALATRYPNATITGVDYAEDAIRRAKGHSQTQKVSNVEFFQHDVTSLPAEWEGKYDFIILFDVLHDLPDPVASLSEIKRVLKSDGIMMFIDPKLSSYHHKNIGDLNSAMYYSVSIYNCLPASLSSAPAAGLGVGWGEEKETEFIKSQNIDVIEVAEFTADEYCNNFVCRKLQQIA